MSSTITTTAADVPLLIISENSSSERRVSPSWTVAQLKARLEPITGIPAGSQSLQLKVASQTAQRVAAADEETTLLQQWPLQPYAEIHVTDLRPPSLRANYTDVSRVEKYEMPVSDYEARNDTVLSWKKSHSLGRFDPSAPSLSQQRVDSTYREIADRHIVVNARCRLLPETDHRRGRVAFVGEVAGLPGVGAWVGVELDEPTGKNDGTVKGVRVFECKERCGVFVRAERVECGDFEVLDELMDEEEEEEEF